MAKTIPSFGTMMRATRNGFRWTEEYRLFVRVSGSGPFRVEIAPPTAKVDERDSPIEYLEWWAGTDNPLSRLTALNKYMGKNVSHTFWVDEDGIETIPPAAASIESLADPMPEPAAVESPAKPQPTPAPASTPDPDNHDRGAP
jgi:hypothetical protein